MTTLFLVLGVLTLLSVVAISPELCLLWEDKYQYLDDTGRTLFFVNCVLLAIGPLCTSITLILWSLLQ